MECLEEECRNARAVPCRSGPAAALRQSFAARSEIQTTDSPQFGCTTHTFILADRNIAADTALMTTSSEYTRHVSGFARVYGVLPSSLFLGLSPLSVLCAMRVRFNITTMSPSVGIKYSASPGHVSTPLFFTCFNHCIYGSIVQRSPGSPGSPGGSIKIKCSHSSVPCTTAYRASSGYDPCICFSLW